MYPVSNAIINMVIKMKSYKDIVWLFGINVFISTFTFGGGYVVIPMIRKYYVEKKAYFDEDELMKIAAIAINMSALAGYRVKGVSGMIISCIAAILPPLVILAVVSRLYAVIQNNTVVQAVLHGMEAGVAALIVDLIVDMYALICKEKEFFFTLMTPLVCMLNYFFQINVAILIIASALLCVVRVYCKRRSVRI